MERKRYTLTDRQTEVTLSVCHAQYRENARCVMGCLRPWRDAHFICPAPDGIWSNVSVIVAPVDRKPSI